MSNKSSFEIDQEENGSLKSLNKPLHTDESNKSKKVNMSNRIKAIVAYCAFAVCMSLMNVT